MRKSFKDSLKALEADIQHANTLASDYSREYDGACLQMRLSYSPVLTFSFSCFNGLIVALLVYGDGKTTMSVYERKASLSEFYGVIFPSLLQLHKGITDIEEKKQREICATKYRRRDEMEKGKLSEIEIEREEECGICMEMDTKFMFTMLLDVQMFPLNSSDDVRFHRPCRRARSQSCPFCRDSLKRVNSGELWIYTSNCDITDLSAIGRENLKRLFMYIDKLPLVIPDPVVVSYAPHFR
ncbi:E3 ubiquitin-protein ligase AIRP2 [Sesamum angolense]|uniref:E3 ubiquitin-protein ligase AIRP2 n=1 Tax=Sesamum angolense TaxID=2727404 RepID=A0AAE1WFH6_9LAMI|nr:E3 ubiquitin-protein ligase AIRP2 [Sesamum angolense]